MDSSMTDVFCYLMSSRVQDLCGRILASLERQETRSVSMMAVAVRNRHYVLLYNPDWLAKAHYDDVVATVRHEAYHIILEHIPRHLESEAVVQSSGDPREVQLFHTVSPFAADLAVNSLLVEASGNEYMREHRKEWVLPGLDPFKGVPGKMSFEWYVLSLTNTLRKNQDSAKKFQNTLQQILDQAGFGSDDANNSEMFRDPRDAQNEEGEKQSDGGGTGSEDGEEETDKEGPPSSGKQKKCDDANSGEDGSGEGEGDADEDGDEDTAGEGDDEKDADEKHQGHGFDLLKNHRDWNDQSLEEPPESKNNLADELRYEAKAIIKHAVEEHEKGRGTIPTGLQEIIEKLLKEPQVPWTRIFRNIVASAKRTRRRRSLGRPRRRHIAIPEFIPFPGKKKDYSYHIAFCIDTSGSMGSKELEMGLNELEGMRKLDKDMTVTVIEADAAVERVYELGSSNDPVEYDVRGRGGTSFDPALLHAQKLNPAPDAVFYFTDGYAPAPQKESRVPCMFAWIITPTGKVPDEWGMHIQTRPYD